MGWVGFETELGKGWLLFDGSRIVEIGLPGATPPEGPEVEEPGQRVAEMAACLEAYYAGLAHFIPRTELAEEAGSTPLQKEIYRAVLAIRPGETRSYGEIAAAAGRPGAARAVGTAMARNPFPPVIPCHRVIAADGGLGGYGGGLDQKEQLLRMEGAVD